MTSREGGAKPRGRRTILLALVLTASVVEIAAAEQVHRERLDNGLTVIVRDNPLAPVVAVSVLLKMGARWEREQNAGISNFLQAVIVKGTTRRDGAELADAIAGLGGKMTAYGEVDYSEIRGSALARFWRELLRLTAELAREPKLAPADVDSERDWLLSRLQRRHDNAPARAFDELYALLYGPHPYGRPPLGTRESLTRIDHAALVEWYRSFYRPERMIVVVSGQVAIDEVRAEVRRLFGGMVRGGDTAPPSNPRPVSERRRIVIEQPAQQAQILVGTLAPALDDPDHAAVKVLSTLLGGGMAGRLFVELRDRRGLAYSATSYYDPVKEPGALVLYLGTAPENVERAEAALGREIERIRREPVAAEELTRAKNYLLGRYEMDRRTNERRAWYLGFYELEDVGAEYPERYRGDVERVTAADVLRVAQRYLTGLTTVVLRPAAAAAAR
jgi:predicted Zn-dependent peptidase